MNNYKYIYIYDHYCVYLHAKKTTRTLKKSQSCVYFFESSVIFRDLRSLKLLAHFDINIHHLDERRNTVLHQAVLGKKPGGEIWKYALKNRVGAMFLWLFWLDLWLAMIYGPLWTSIGLMFSYVFIACACVARLIFIGSRCHDTASVNAIVR
jgi:hypothetical protein